MFRSIFPDMNRELKDSLYYITKEKVRAKITNNGVRPDGRSLTEIRPIWCEHGLLPRVHGSAVFTRGQTQVMTTYISQLKGMGNYERAVAVGIILLCISTALHLEEWVFQKSKDKT